MADEEEDMTPEQAARMQKENCIFCKIISGDIPSKKIYDDSDFVGILDINPAAEGHVLLLPKQHFQILPQMPQEIVGNLGIACSNVSAKILKTFKCDGTSIFMANGAVAGQRAPHFMVHIIPRKDNDDISLNPQLKEIEDKLFDSIKEKLFLSVKAHSSPKTNAEPEEQEEETEAKEEEEETERKEENEESEENREEAEPEEQEEQKADETEEQDEDEEKINEEEKKQILNIKRPKKKNKAEKEKSSKSLKKPRTKEAEPKAKPKKTEEPEESEEQEEETLQPSQGIDYDKLARMFK